MGGKKCAVGKTTSRFANKITILIILLGMTKARVNVPSLSAIQRKELIGYMHSHSNFAKNKITALGFAGSNKCTEMWQRLTQKLNDLPGPKFEASELPHVITNL